MRPPIGVVAAVCAAVALLCTRSAAAYDNCLVLDEDSGYTMRWSIDNGTSSIAIQLTIQHVGWLGLGFQSSAIQAMGPGDFVTGWEPFAGVGNVTIQDRYLNASTQFGLPDLDDVDNLENKAGTNPGNGTVTLSWTRALDTGDSDDINLAKHGHDISIIWAFGTEPAGETPSYHGQNRGKAGDHINLFGSHSCAPSPCPLGCSGHGTCDKPTKKCTCASGWYSNSCALRDLTVLSTPKGFNVSYFAHGVEDARQLAQSLHDPRLVYVGSRVKGVVYALIDSDLDGVSDETVVILKDLDMPNGVAWYEGSLFVGCADQLVRYDNIDSNYRKLGAPDAVLIADIPTANGNWHGWKYLRFNDEGKLYMPIGSPCNYCLRNDTPGDPQPTQLHKPWGTITTINPDGSDRSVYATGLRNSVGLAFSSVTKVPWFTDNGRDTTPGDSTTGGFGANKPWDELNSAPSEGLNFGFPFCYAGGLNLTTGGPDPQFYNGTCDAASGFTGARLELGPHVAPLGLTFYTGKMFPSSNFTNNLLIALHGSWNRPANSLTGCKVVKVNFDPTGTVPESQEDFVAGFMDPDRATRWARPVDVLQMHDGSALISDDFGGFIFRVSFMESTDSDKKQYT